MTAYLSSNPIVVASNDQVSSTVDGEEVILSLDSGTYFRLAGVGTRIWKIIQTPTKTKEIYSTICDEYDISSEQCREDIQQFLSKLDEENLIEVRNE